jgi:hypothetical protein
MESLPVAALKDMQIVWTAAEKFCFMQKAYNFVAV